MCSWGDDQQVVDALLEAERAIWASVQPSSTHPLPQCAWKPILSSGANT
jgi:hypothetical protein